MDCELWIMHWQKGSCRRSLKIWNRCRGRIGKRLSICCQSKLTLIVIRCSLVGGSLWWELLQCWSYTMEQSSKLCLHEILPYDTFPYILILLKEILLPMARFLFLYMETIGLDVCCVLQDLLLSTWRPSNTMIQWFSCLSFRQEWLSCWCFLSGSRCKIFWQLLSRSASRVLRFSLKRQDGMYRLPHVMSLLQKWCRRFWDCLLICL